MLLLFFQRNNFEAPQQNWQDFFCNRCRKAGKVSTTLGRQLQSLRRSKPHRARPIRPWDHIRNLDEFTNHIVRLLAERNGVARIFGVRKKVTELGVNLAEEILVGVFQRAKPVPFDCTFAIWAMCANFVCGVG